MQTALATQFTKVSDKLELTQRTVEVEDTETVIETEFLCNIDVELAGDSIWDCTLERVTVTGIYIREVFEDEDVYTSVNVTYNVDGDVEYEGSWRLYTDNGFSDAISELLGTAVDFTEQGMQDDGFASMEM
jgi:hypothetical protein